jgi:hypothetical protein
MTRMKLWTVGLGLCFLLVSSKASATYVVIENISQNAPNWGDCNCIQATGWLDFITMDFSVVDSDGSTYDFTLISRDYYTKRQLKGRNFVLLDVTYAKRLGPGERYTSKKILGLADTQFRFTSRGADIGVYYCELPLVGCGGYSTGMTDVWPDGLFITPGLSGSDSFEFQVPAAGSMNGPAVVRVTFYPGNPPGPGQGK